MPEDVAATAFEVLRHRIILTYEAEGITTDSLIERLFYQVVEKLSFCAYELEPNML